MKTIKCELCKKPAIAARCLCHMRVCRKHFNECLHVTRKAGAP